MIDLTAYSQMTREELQREAAAVSAQYEQWKSRGLRLNLARGKPGREQLDLVSGILTVLAQPEDCLSDGIDARNYGEAAGLPAARSLFAELLGVSPEE
ncbi:MAG: aminotransferase, partial [Ruthenibacterium sp.]